MRVLRQTSAAVNRVASVLMIVTVLVMLVAAGGQVVLRYGFQSSLHWTQELVGYLFVYVGFVGGSIAFYEKGHLAVDLVSPLLVKSGNSAVIAFRTIVHLLVLFTLGFVTYYGITLCISNAASRSVAMGINMALPYAAVPIGMALMIVHQLAHIEDELFGSPDRTMGSPGLIPGGDDPV
jgi:TRAP-type C4-dicarboxylate transport system permease small subunit